MIYLIDLGAEYWRNYFGAKRSAVRAWELTLDRLGQFRQERAVVCADSPRSARKERFPEYKSNREAKPEDALDSLRAVQEKVRSWGMPLALVDGWEADDVIATLTLQAWPEPVDIVGTEKDFYCLIDGRVRLVDNQRNHVDAVGCLDKFGVAPSQMSDWLALVGDAADAIPGCKNCGPQRATDLLQRFGDILGILAATDEELVSIKGVGRKTADSLRAWALDGAAKSMELVKLNRELPLNLWQILP